MAYVGASLARVPSAAETQLPLPFGFDGFLEEDFINATGSAVDGTSDTMSGWSLIQHFQYQRHQGASAVEVVGQSHDGISYCQVLRSASRGRHCPGEQFIQNANRPAGMDLSSRLGTHKSVKHCIAAGGVRCHLRTQIIDQRIDGRTSMVGVAPQGKPSTLAMGLCVNVLQGLRNLLSLQEIANDRVWRDGIADHPHPFPCFLVDGLHVTNKPQRGGAFHLAEVALSNELELWH